VADALAREMQRAGGLITAADLAAYRAVMRTPLRGTYRDLGIFAVPPPSSGGVTLLQALGMLSGWQLGTTSRTSTYRAHLTAEALSRAFADRNVYLGDPLFVRMPVTGLLAPPYVLERQKTIVVDRATPSASVRAGDAWRFEPNAPRTMPAPPAAADTLRASFRGSAEGDHTTHFSIVDGEGNVVAMTTTLNADFGSGWMAPGTGFLLNDEMDDFAAKPGVPNMFGLVGSDANAIGPGRRPLSSMCPTLVLRAGQPWLVLGSPGGPRIITTVLNILVDMRDYGVTLEQAVAAPRFHHQWWPDVVSHEAGAFPDDVARGLTGMGHRLELRSAWSSAQCIEVAPDGRLRGVSDPRSHGAAMGE
jgi:gamma-glutamyltranspeptidase/glutathione hydrolase